MAESISLAVLENLVHMARQDFPSGYVAITACVPHDLAILTPRDGHLSDISQSGSRAMPGFAHWHRPC